MQTAFTCCRCHTLLAAGETQCPKCGQTFQAQAPPGQAPLDTLSETTQGPQTKPPASIVLRALAFAGLVMAAILPFAVPIFSRARDAARENWSASKLKRIGEACFKYEDDHNQDLPPLDSLVRFKAALAPYLTGDDANTLFVEPGTGAEYVPHWEATKVNLEDICDWTKFVVIREPVPHEDGTVVVLYADGSTAAVTAQSHQQFGPAPCAPSSV